MAAIFRKTIFIISSGIGVWAIYKIFIEQEHLQGGVLLAYVGLVVFSMGRLFRPIRQAHGTRNNIPSPQPSPKMGEGEIASSSRRRRNFSQ